LDTNEFTQMFIDEALMRVLINREQLGYSKINWLINMTDFAVNFDFKKEKLIRHYTSLNTPEYTLRNLDRRIDE